MEAAPLHPVESVEITVLPASVFLLIQAAGSFIMRDSETGLGVSFYLHMAG